MKTYLLILNGVKGFLDNTWKWFLTKNSFGFPENLYGFSRKPWGSLYVLVKNP
jgi:uncharacterized protein (DUF2141 family)